MQSGGDIRNDSAVRDERDRDLFLKFINGDEQAFGELYIAYERPLFLYCRHMLSTDIEAEDVFQEVWLRLIKFRERGEHVGHFRAILFTIARNTAINQIRMRQNRRTVPLSQLRADNHPDGAAWRGGDDMEQLVHKALKRLPEPQREAFVLHAILGYSFQEIAEMQGVTMTGAKTRAFRARTYLRTLLANWLGLAEEEAEEGSETRRTSRQPGVARQR